MVNILGQRVSVGVAVVLGCVCLFPGHAFQRPGPQTSVGDANFREANLFSAELQEISVAGAKFEGARFGQTTIGAVDFSGACGLADVVHVAPSVIWLGHTGDDCRGISTSTRSGS
jgi:hypothetical protein